MGTNRIAWEFNWKRKYKRRMKYYLTGNDIWRFVEIIIIMGFEKLDLARVKKKCNEFQSQILSVFYRSLFPLSSFHSGSLHYESIDDLLCLEILQITFSKVWIRTDFCTPLGHSFTVRQQQYSEETIPGTEGGVQKERHRETWWEVVSVMRQNG